MSNDWVKDIAEMHKKYGVNDWVRDPKNKEQLRQFLVFRLDFLEEEFDETQKAFFDGNKEEIVDGLIDLCVIAIGTLNAFDIDAHEAWNRVFKANMDKEVGIKPGRPNPLGLPDLIKPKGWKGPEHNDNTGLLPNAV
tara:strand:- start:158 stop:568 length:411 start_codon:yes stop_codon:yes gene_type:complete